MSGLCLSSTAKTKTFTSLLISGFTLLWSFIISHPLHFFLLVFFSPYLPKLLSFLSPLLITTSLLLFALFTIINDKISTEFSKGKMGFLLSACHAVLQRLQPKIDNEDGEDLRSEQALEVYKTVFETSMVDGVLEENNPEEKILQAVESSVMKVPHHDRDGSITIHEDLTAYENVEAIKPVIFQENKRIEEFLNELVDMNCSVNEKKVEPPPGTKADKVVDRQKEDLIVMNGSEAITGNESNNTREFTSKTSRLQQQCQIDRKEYFRRQKARSNIEYTDNAGEYTYGSSRSMDYDLGSYGSTRKEKEWKRTLACKLFEERHKNGDGDEGMDLLWETYEMESSAKANAKTNTKMKKKKKEEIKSKGEIQSYADEDDDDDDDEEQEEDDEIDRQQLCCLQAFKFSAGKMNMGVGRRNLVRFSKAVKGFGWLHHVSRLRKKVHNGDSF